MVVLGDVEVLLDDAALYPSLLTRFARSLRKGS